MSYTAATYRDLVDARPVSAYEVISDHIHIAQPDPLVPLAYVPYNIIEVPAATILPGWTSPIRVQSLDQYGDPIRDFEMVISPAQPTSQQFMVDPATTYSIGTIWFNAADCGTAVRITVWGRGSLIFSSDINDIADELIEARGSYASIGDRLDDHISGTTVERYDTEGDGSSPVFELPFPYGLGTNGLMVYVGGFLQTANGADYSETDSTHVTFVSPPGDGQNVSFIHIH